LLTGADTLGAAIHTSLTRGTPSTYSGTIGDPNAVDLYQVDLAVGERLSANVDVTSISSTLSSYVRIFNSSGSEVASGGSFGDASAARQLWRRLRRLHGPHFRYLLRRRFRFQQFLLRSEHSRQR
jgi:hypothetical protein